MPATVSGFRDTYSGLTDDDLVRLVAEVPSLVPNARAALHLELTCRHLPANGIDWAEQPVPPKPTQSNGSFGRFAKHLGIYIACDAIYIIILGLILAEVFPDSPPTLPKAFATLMVTAYGNAALGLAVVTSKWIIPKRTKTVWIIGAIGPAVMILATVGYAITQSH